MARCVFVDTVEVDNPKDREWRWFKMGMPPWWTVDSGCYKNESAWISRRVLDYGYFINPMDFRRLGVKRAIRTLTVEYNEEKNSGKSDSRSCIKIVEISTQCDVSDQSIGWLTAFLAHTERLISWSLDWLINCLERCSWPAQSYQPRLLSA